MSQSNNFDMKAFLEERFKVVMEAIATNQALIIDMKTESRIRSEELAIRIDGGKLRPAAPEGKGKVTVQAQQETPGTAPVVRKRKPNVLHWFIAEFVKSQQSPKVIGPIEHIFTPDRIAAARAGVKEVASGSAGGHVKMMKRIAAAMWAVTDMDGRQKIKEIRKKEEKKVTISNATSITPDVNTDDEKTTEVAQ